MSKNKGINNITKPVYDTVTKETNKKIGEVVGDIPTDAEITALAKAAITADKDILSQIEVVYFEDDNITHFIFPTGIMPLSITLNTHRLYFKNTHLVDNNGQEVVGYELDDYDIYNGKLIISIIDDLSEQVINDITYILFNVETNVIRNTYNLFYPDIPKKIYCHPITISNSTNVNIISKMTCLIFNNDPTPFTKTTFRTYLDNLYNQIGDTVRIMTSGAFTDSNNKISIACYLAKTSSAYTLVGFAVDGTFSSFRDFSTEQDFEDFIVGFNDGVNVIN